MIDHIKKLIEDKIAKIKGAILDRATRRDLERKANKQGMTKEQAEYEHDSVKNRGEAEEIYELIARSLLQLGYYLSPEVEYLPQGMRTRIVIKALSYEDHQKYCKEAGYVYKKATKESIKAHEEKEKAVQAATEDAETKKIITSPNEV